MIETFDLFACDDDEGSGDPVAVLVDNAPVLFEPYRLARQEREAAITELAARYDLRVMWEGWRRKVARYPQRLFLVAHVATRRHLAQSTDADAYADVFALACRVLTGRLPFDARNAGFRPNGRAAVLRAA